MPRVHALYFASLREEKGVADEWVDSPPGCTAGALFDGLFPASRARVALAVNRQRVAADFPLSEGDEIAFLPPLGGG